MKKAVAFMLTALMVFGLTACGGGDYSGDYSYALEDYVTLGEYKGLEYQEPDLTVTDEDLQEEIALRLDDARGSDAYSLTLTDQPLEVGDVLTVDFLGKIDGVAFDGGEATDAALTIGAGGYIPGFEEGLIGWKVGDTGDLEVVFPADYRQTDLAGKTAVFTITVKSGIRPLTPEYNLDFVTATTDYTTLEEYESVIREELMTLRAQEAATAKENALWNQVMEGAQFSGYPEEELAARKQENLEYYTAMAQQYELELNEFVSEYFGMDEASFSEYMDTYARTIVEQELVMYAIAKAEGISVSRAEYKERLLEILQEQGYESEADFKAANGKSFEEVAGKVNLQKTFLLEEVIQFIADHAKTVKASADTAEAQG